MEREGYKKIRINSFRGKWRLIQSIVQTEKKEKRKTVEDKEREGKGSIL